MSGAWDAARVRATRRARLKVHVVFVAAYIGLGPVLLLSFDDPRPALIVWALLFLPFFVVFYYLAARTGWGSPRDFVCPGCHQFVPFNAEQCPSCGYRPAHPATGSFVRVTARKVPKAK